ncbi:MAG: SurA N-terminal domain-containing protein [Elusimicrobiales bacterium]|nr:SurA N-terminal domain-containing protein [Elusimicrobiales bacterium]
MIFFLNKHKKPIFIATVGIFLASILFLGGNFLSSSSAGAVADVGGKKIMYKDFIKRVNMVLDNISESGTSLNEIIRNGVKQEVFRDMIVEELLCAEAKKNGMEISDFEIAMEVQNTPQFKNNGVFNQRLYYQLVWDQLHMTPSEYEAWRKKARLATKFKEFVYSGVKITPEELKKFYFDSNKGKLKKFEKEKAEYSRKLIQEKFLSTMNYHLQRLTAQIEIKSYLKEREEGR